MAAPKGLNDLRSFLKYSGHDYVWLRLVLAQYLNQNHQTDGNLFDDHAVWNFRNTVTEFAKLLDEDPEPDDDED